jgi:Zn-dependent alcohol dehydrogenase
VGQLAVEELDEPSPRAGEVKLRMVATGVCRTDLSVLQGHLKFPLPIVLGHEGAGVVEALGAGVTSLAVGDPVVCTIVPSCERCYYCVHEEPALCAETQIGTGKMLDGTTRLTRGAEAIHSLSYQASFAELAIVPERCAIRVRRDAPLERLCGLACGVSTGLGAALLRADVEAGSSVVALGAGGVGLSALMGARLRGAAIRIAADIAPQKLAKARELGLATHTIDVGRERFVERVRDITGGRGADCAFDAVGAPGTLEDAVEAIRVGGVAVVIGHAAGVVEAKLDTTRFLRHKWVTGTFGGSIHAKRHIPEFVDLYLAGQLDLDGLMDRTYRLDEIATAFGDLDAGRITRGVVRF